MSVPWHGALRTRLFVKHVASSLVAYANTRKDEGNGVMMYRKTAQLPANIDGSVCFMGIRLFIELPKVDEPVVCLVRRNLERPGKAYAAAWTPLSIWQAARSVYQVRIPQNNAEKPPIVELYNGIGSLSATYTGPWDKNGIDLGEGRIAQVNLVVRNGQPVTPPTPILHDPRIPLSQLIMPEGWE